MIKKYWEITVRDYDVVERTGKISHLKKWWNILPVGLFSRRIANTLKQLAEIINGEDIEDEEEFRWQVESLNRIIGLKSAYYGLLRIYGVGSIHNYLLSFIKAKKETNEAELLEVYRKRIKLFTDIDVKNEKDIKKVRMRLNFWTDKYNKHFGNKQVSEHGNEKTYLISVVISVMGYMNMNYEPTMTVLEFIETRRIAEEQSRKLKQNAGN